jgi:alpha-tubulin suppressor-like RCC1 family protein
MLRGVTHRWWVAIAIVLVGCPTPTPQTPPPQPPTTPTPTQPQAQRPVDAIVQIAARDAHSCATRHDGTVLCWGKNTYGQLGDGSREDRAHAVRVVGMSDAVEVAVGVDFSCARRKNGSVACWGNDQDGQLGGGKGGRPGAISVQPQSVFGLRDVVQISAGEYHACARTRDGAVKCWGNAENGQLGSDAQRVFATPRTIADVDAIAIACGGNHVCAVAKTGKLLCWGRNTEGEIGDGQSGSRMRASEVAGVTDAVDVAAGIAHSCARRKGGGIVCWGDNTGGQLGAAAGRDRKRDRPVAIAGVPQTIQLAMGGDTSCALQSSGRVLCWGGNEAGQLGPGVTGASRNAPIVVRGVDDAIAIALGRKHVCAARKRGDAVCWGSNEHGALGPRPLH